mmetsp:Transcript_5922/g.25179  ORF Transcript_5922/g.25179 Transcript_5922/m.25179 type:complete len:409 (-) Transcript_5922:308-1534(-)
MDSGRCAVAGAKIASVSASADATTPLFPGPSGAPKSVTPNLPMGMPSLRVCTRASREKSTYSAASASPPSGAARNATIFARVVTPDNARRLSGTSPGPRNAASPSTGRRPQPPFAPLAVSTCAPGPGVSASAASANVCGEALRAARTWNRGTTEVGGLCARSSSINSKSAFAPAFASGGCAFAWPAAWFANTPKVSADMSCISCASAGAMPSTPTSSSTSFSFTSSSSSYILTMHGVAASKPGAAFSVPRGRFSASSGDASPPGCTCTASPPSRCLAVSVSSFLSALAAREDAASSAAPAPASAAATESSAPSASSAASISTSSSRALLSFLPARSSLIFAGVLGGAPTPAPSRRRTHALSPGTGTQYSTRLSQILRSAGWPGASAGPRSSVYLVVRQRPPASRYAPT